ncbi:hypothetical protein BDV59DRAFT_34193 [Aspergillus ambiguus]|uniref:uncharacterized protein n=1 Tax=Aspergillus ambiguus TaxID=176160 RepID=UPI003CCCC94C
MLTTTPMLLSHSNHNMALATLGNSLAADCQLKAHWEPTLRSRLTDIEKAKLPRTQKLRGRRRWDTNVLFLLHSIDLGAGIVWVRPAKIYSESLRDQDEPTVLASILLQAKCPVSRKDWKGAITKELLGLKDVIELQELPVALQDLDPCPNESQEDPGDLVRECQGYLGSITVVE